MLDRVLNHYRLHSLEKMKPGGEDNEQERYQNQKEYIRSIQDEVVESLLKLVTTTLEVEQSQRWEKHATNDGRCDNLTTIQSMLKRRVKKMRTKK